MFDLGWGELLLIGVVALIVVGPKDLPGMFRTLGRFTGKIKRMAREFQRAMDDAADEAGVKETADSLKGLTSPKNMGLDRLNDVADKFDKWDPTKPSKRAREIGTETEKLSEERAEAARKIREYTTEKAGAKRAAEAAAKAEAEAAGAEATPVTKAKPVKTKTKAVKPKATTAKVKSAKPKMAKEKPPSAAGSAGRKP